MTAVSDAPTASIFHLSGDLDISSEGQLARTLAAAAAASRTSATALILDLSDVTFLDCAGLRLLLEARNALGHDLWLRHPARPVTRLLDLTRLSATFNVC